MSSIQSYRHIRPLAVSAGVVFGIATLAGTSFSATSSRDEAVEARREQAQQHLALVKISAYEQAQAAKTQQEVGAYLSALQQADQQRQQQEAAARAERQRKADEAARQARASRSATRTRGAATGNWSALINQYPWPTGTAYRIMMCESGGNANALNRSSGATGLFQILNGPSDPAANVATAFRMYQSRGWQPWNASRSCWA